MGFFDGLIDAGIGLMNYNAERENQAYLREAQQETWRREDNAVQRRVADMQAAGINPVLAAGGSASSSSPIQTGTPSLHFSAMDHSRLAMDQVSAKAAVDRTNADKNLVQEKLKQEQYNTLAIKERANADWLYNRVLTAPDPENYIQDTLIGQKAKADVTKAITEAKERSRSLDFDVANEIYNKSSRDLAASGKYVEKLIMDFNDGKLSLAQFLAIVGTLAGR